MTSENAPASIAPPIAIHPPSCDCTGCLGHQYKPLDQTSAEERQAMILGDIRDSTGMSFLELHAWQQENDPEALSLHLAAA